MTTAEKVSVARQLLEEAIDELNSNTSTGSNQQINLDIDTIDDHVQTIKQFV